MGNCVKICTVESLGSASDYPGYLRRYDDKLWFSDGSTWIEISGKIETVSYPIWGGQTVFFIADRNFVITDMSFQYPITSSFSSIKHNEELYVVGTPIYYGDRIEIISDEHNTLTVVKEYFDVPTLNLQATINYNFPFDNYGGMSYYMSVGIKNVSVVPTTDVFRFYVQKLSPIADFDVNPVTTQVDTPLATYYVENSNFTILEQATRWRFTSNSGVILQPMSTMWVGFEILGASIGNGNLTVTVVSGTGGSESPTTDNIFVKEYAVNSI